MQEEVRETLQCRVEMAWCRERRGETMCKHTYDDVNHEQQNRSSGSAQVQERRRSRSRTRQKQKVAKMMADSCT